MNRDPRSGHCRKALLSVLVYFFLFVSLRFPSPIFLPLSAGESLDAVPRSSTYQLLPSWRFDSILIIASQIARRILDSRRQRDYEVDLSVREEALPSNMVSLIQPSPHSRLQPSLPSPPLRACVAICCTASCGHLTDSFRRNGWHCV